MNKILRSYNKQPSVSHVTLTHVLLIYLPLPLSFMYFLLSSLLTLFSFYLYYLCLCCVFLSFSTPFIYTHPLFYALLLRSRKSWA